MQPYGDGHVCRCHHKVPVTLMIRKIGKRLIKVSVGAS